MLVVLLVMSTGTRTSLVASNILVGSLGLISLCDNGWDVTAGLTVAVGRGHGRHDGRFGIDRGVAVELCVSYISVQDGEEVMKGRCQIQR